DALQNFEVSELNLEEVMEFIGNATQVSTSSVLDDLAQLGKDEMHRLRRLRTGFRSRVVKKASSNAALYLLIAKGQLASPALFDASARFIFPPYEINSSLEVLRQVREKPVYDVDYDIDHIHLFEEKCLETWLQEAKAERAQVKIVCALHFV
ncbi:MAG TPA: hypothetical protein PLY93_02015, partial [Turneriella sp.]|nr:hypothetical protein [Turneriella sp.]